MTDHAFEAQRRGEKVRVLTCPLKYTALEDIPGCRDEATREMNESDDPELWCKWDKKTGKIVIGEIPKMAPRKPEPPEEPITTGYHIDWPNGKVSEYEIPQV